MRPPAFCAPARLLDVPAGRCCCCAPPRRAAAGGRSAGARGRRRRAFARPAAACCCAPRRSFVRVGWTRCCRAAFSAAAARPLLLPDTHAGLPAPRCCCWIVRPDRSLLPARAALRTTTRFGLLCPGRWATLLQDGLLAVLGAQLVAGLVPCRRAQPMRCCTCRPVPAGALFIVHHEVLYGVAVAVRTCR